MTVLEGVSYVLKCTYLVPLKTVSIAMFTSVTLRRQLAWTTINVVFVTIVSFLRPKSILLVTFSGLRRSDPRTCNIWSTGRYCCPLHATEEYQWLLASMSVCIRNVQTVSFWRGCPLLTLYRLQRMHNIQFYMVRQLRLNRELCNKISPQPIENTRFGGQSGTGARFNPCTLVLPASVIPPMPVLIFQALPSTLDNLCN